MIGKTWLFLNLSLLAELNTVGIMASPMWPVQITDHGQVIWISHIEFILQELSLFSSILH